MDPSSAPNIPLPRTSFQSSSSSTPLPSFDHLLPQPNAIVPPLVVPNASTAMNPDASAQHQQPQQSASNPNMDSPSETPHDLYCRAKDLGRRGRTQEAAALYLKASMNGHLSAMVAYATHLVHTNERAAFVWFRAAAERGDSCAWYELGQLLARGRYFEVNAIDAARCWKRAAQMGDNTGKSALGLCYIRGFGVKQDPEKGVEIVKLVADVYNDVTAMKNLAWIYRNGKGVPKDLEAAEYWEDRARKQDDVMGHIHSREHTLFGRRSRHSKHRVGRENEKVSSRPGTRENSGFERVVTPTRDSHISKEHDSDKQSKLLRVDELEGRLQDVSSELYVQPSVQSKAAALQEAVLREQSISSMPASRSHFDDSLQGNTRLAHSANVKTQDSSSLERDVGPEVHDANTRHEVETGPYLVGDHTVKKQTAPVLGAKVADLSFISKDKDMESPRNYNPEPTYPSHSTPSDSRATARMSIRQDAKYPPSSHQIPVQNWSSEPSERLGTTSFREQSQTLPKSTTADHSDDKHKYGLRTENIVDEESQRTHDLSNTGLPRDEFQMSRDHVDNGHDNHGNNGGGQKFSMSVGATDFLTNQNTEFNDDHDHDEANRQQGTFVTGPMHSIGPAVTTRKQYFESAEQRDLRFARESGIGESSATEDHIRKTQKSAAATVAETRIMPDGDIENFSNNSNDNGKNAINENVEYGEFGASAQNLKSAMSTADANDSYEERVAQSVASTGRDDGTSTEITQNTDILVQRATMNEPIETKVSIDPDALDRLHQALSNFPANPMRADSQAPLKTMVKMIQDVTVSNVDAYTVIEKNYGFYKVIVAMISQHEDEHIQEHGLHSLLRILRATPSTKESAVLTSYADCFKVVQGNADVIVPKGTVGVSEEVSGAVQAVIHAMRHHASTRRIQLAGCATLGEIASASIACRSIALEQGSVNLLLACLRHRSSSSAAVIHEMAGRAVSSFCNGKENVLFKEAFTNAGAVSELLNVLQLWGHSDEASSDLMTNATVCCCHALRHLTDGYPAASIQCVQSFAYHNLIRIMVLRREDVAVCTVVLTALTSITRNAGTVAEKPLIDAKPLPEVLATMQKHSENALFIRKALDFMEALGSYPAMREEIVVAGGIPFAADIIQQGGNDGLLLEKACGVIEKLCRSSTPNQEIFTSRNGMKSLTTLLNSHSRQPGVVERGLNSMSSVTSNNAASQREAFRASAAEELVRILTIYSSKNAKVVAACTGAMSALVVPKNMSMAQTFAGSKAPELVVRAMKRHPDNVMVQENGSAAIAAFCEADPHIMSSLLKSGITTTLVVALQRFLHRPTAVVQIVRAMRAITNEAVPDDSYRFKSKLLTDRSNESSLPEIFHTALSYHKKSLPDTANVIISICATINRLCMRSVAFKNEVGKDGIVEELKRLVERTAEFRDLGALQPVLATICTLVLESEENKNRFHSVGGVEAILDVMQKWKQDTFVLEHCCAALRYSCNDHFGNCDEVKNHNGVRSILGVMEMHPDNVNVTLWCCLTLADLCKGDEELQSSATVKQGIRKVVSAMNMFSTNSRFLSSACEFLRAASVCNADNQERIVRLGGRTVIVKALENHPTDNALTESAAYALLQIQHVPDPRSSVDSSPQVGLVKRLSRDLRRSGSSSNRSNRSSKNKIGRKSLSFTSRRRTTGDEQHGDREGSRLGNEDDEEVRPRPVKTSSLINLQRLIPRRRSRVEERDSEDEAEMGNEQEEVDEYSGAHHGYGDDDDYDDDDDDDDENGDGEDGDQYRGGEDRHVDDHH